MITYGRLWAIAEVGSLSRLPVLLAGIGVRLDSRTKSAARHVGEDECVSTQARDLVSDRADRATSVIRYIPLARLDAIDDTEEAALCCPVGLNFSHHPTASCEFGRAARERGDEDSA